MEHTNKSDAKYNKYSKPYPKHIVDAMEDVISVPSGPRRWRMSVAVYLNLNPINPENGLTAKEEYNVVVKDLKEKRLNLKTRFGGVNKSSEGLRENLEIPEGAWNFIKMFDPDAFSSKNPDCRKNLTKLAEEFKELSVAEAH